MWRECAAQAHGTKRPDARDGHSYETEKHRTHEVGFFSQGFIVIVCERRVFSRVFVSKMTDNVEDTYYTLRVRRIHRHDRLALIDEGVRTLRLTQPCAALTL
mgnify:CR=1 FL=1